jgi:pSer/pThr/pTyr-binding forkhead associated (FHA) protein
VDLTAYNAYANGVSRLHAAIKLVKNRIVIVDLGSSNGTYVNGKRLAPYLETLVSHGDLIYLGKLKMQILID